jgi:N-acetylglucosamine-6-phosphate deacetylase
MDSVVRIFPEETMENVIFRKAHIASEGQMTVSDVYVSSQKFCKAIHGAEVDCSGLILSPGLVDLQINGYGGKEFVGCDDTIALAQSKLIEHGVTAFLPTIVSQPIEKYRPSAFKASFDKAKKRKGAEVLGWHLEGPFLHPLQHGAHPQTALLDYVDEPFWRAVFATGAISMMTLAPELEVAPKLLDILAEYKVAAAVGHSQAEAKDLVLAKSKGAKFVTHLFNAMIPFHHRAPGIVGSILGTRIMGYTLVCDLYHVHPEAVQIAWRCHPSGLALVSDGAPLMDSEEKEGYFCGTRVYVSGEKVVTAHGGNLVGSILGLDELLRRFLRVTDCSFAEAIRYASEIPALYANVEHRKGKIALGYDADCVLWEFSSGRPEVIATMVMGEFCYAKPHFWQRVTRE